MRMVQIFLFVILFACNNTSETNADPIKPSTQVAEKSEKVNNEQMDDQMVPKLGGPADFTISIEGVQSATSYLIGFVAEGHFRMDSSEFDGNKLNFVNPEGYPQGLYYVSLPTNEFVQVILGEDQKFELSCNANDLINSATVNGSKENEIFYQNLKFESTYNPKYRAISAELKGIADKQSQAYQNVIDKRKNLEKERIDHLNDIYKGNEDLLFVQFKKAGQNPTIRESGTDDEKVYHYRKEFWDNVDWSDIRLIRTPVIINKLKRYFNEITPQNPDSIMSSANMLVDQVLDKPGFYKFITNWIAIQFEPTKTNLMDPEAVFVNMIQEYFTRDRAFWADSMEVYALQQRAGEMAQSLVGLQGPDVVSTNEKGESKSIYEMTADYIIVYLYNPTCEHCMKETPLLVDWYNKNKANNKADVYAIAIDTNDDEWKAYIKKNNMTFTNVYDPTNRSIYAKYYVDITPEVYVLNKERKIIGKNLKVFQIDTVIDKDIQER